MTTPTRSDIVARTRVSRHLWARWLLTVLAGCEILMAAGAAPLLMAAGVLGGAALGVAAWFPTTRRARLLGLVLIGTLPFALVGWTAIAPILVLLAGAAITLTLTRDTTGGRGAPPAHSTARAAKR